MPDSLVVVIEEMARNVETIKYCACGCVIFLFGIYITLQLWWKRN